MCEFGLTEAFETLSKEFKSNNENVAPVYHRLKNSLLERYRTLAVSTDDPAVVIRSAKEIHLGLPEEIESTIAAYQLTRFQYAATESKKTGCKKRQSIRFNDFPMRLIVRKEKYIESKYDISFQKKCHQFITEEDSFSKKLSGTDPVDYPNEYENLIKLAKEILNVAPENESMKWKSVMQKYTQLLQQECPDHMLQQQVKRP